MIVWEAFLQRYNELSAALLTPDLERSKRQLFQKEHSYLGNLLTKHKEIQELQEKLSTTKKEAVAVTDPDLAAMFQEEINSLESQIKQGAAELEDLMFPPEEIDKCSAFIEIRAGTGGQEASLFAADLLRMYSNYALKRGWEVSIVSAAQTDLKGFREVIAHIRGKNVYGNLKYESGVHRVQRVPQTETAGRVHTSTVTVAVFPEVEEENAITIAPEDLRIDVFRASGAGGQHVNTTDSAVRITHLPTGVVVSCQDERSQHKNKAKALKILQARLIAEQERKREEELGQKRKELVGRGMRAEKARTYNFPQNRVTDHAAEVTFSNLDMIIDGDMDKLIASLQEHEKEERRKQPLALDL